MAVRQVAAGLAADWLREVLKNETENRSTVGWLVREVTKKNSKHIPPPDDPSK